MLQNEKEIGETSWIEKVNKERYNHDLWSTIGWALWFGALQFIVSGSLKNRILIGIIALIFLSGWALWIVQGIKFRKTQKMIEKDEVLRDALNDELYIENAKRAGTIGYMAMLCAVAIFYAITLFFTIPASVVCGLLLYVGVLSVYITRLVLNKD